MRTLLRAPLAVLLVLAVAPAPRAHAQDRPADDSGTYVISLRGEKLGVERFSFHWAGEELQVESSSYQQIPDGTGTLGLDKRSLTRLNAADYGLRSYLSNQVFQGDTLVRGLEPTETDTVLSVIREYRGVGDLARKPTPPGRIFVLDSPPLFSTFDLIGRTLHGRTFTERPINLYVLGASDTAVVARVRMLGTETLRWGAGPVQARKLEIADASASFLVWMSPRGRMLRFEQPATGLVVERESAPVKPAARRPGG